MKIAAIEAMWKTEPAPASFTLFGVPDAKAQHEPLRDQGALGARADRHALDRQADAGHRRSGGARRGAHRERHDRLRRAREAARRTGSDPPGARRARRACRRSRLCAAAQALRRRSAQGRRRRQIAKAAADTVPGVVPLFWSLPRHGRASASTSSRCSPRRSGCAAKRDFSTPLAVCSCACGRCRCPGSPPSSAGSSPNTAASPGRSTACCRRSSPSSSVSSAQVLFTLCGFVLFYSALAGRRRHPDAQIRAHGAGRGARPGAVARARRTPA